MFVGILIFHNLLRVIHQLSDYTLISCVFITIFTSGVAFSDFCSTDPSTFHPSQPTCAPAFALVSMVMVNASVTSANVPTPLSAVCNYFPTVILRGRCYGIPFSAMNYFHASRRRLHPQSPRTSGRRYNTHSTMYSSSSAPRCL